MAVASVFSKINVEYFQNELYPGSMEKRKRGRPAGATGPLIPCGWCHEEMTTTALCKHLASCPARPDSPKVQAEEPPATTEAERTLVPIEDV